MCLHSRCGLAWVAGWTRNNVQCVCQVLKHHLVQLCESPGRLHGQVMDAAPMRLDVLSTHPIMHLQCPLHAPAGCTHLLSSEHSPGTVLSLHFLVRDEMEYYTCCSLPPPRGSQTWMYAPWLGSAQL